MKKVFIATLCATALLGCNSNEIEQPTPEPVDTGIIIDDSNAKEIISLLDELNVYTTLPATLAYNREIRELSKTDSLCTISGELSINTQSDSSSSMSTFNYDNCSYVDGHSLDGSYTTTSHFEEDLSSISIQTRGKLKNQINNFATMMEMDVDIVGSAEQYEIDYRFDFKANLENIEGDFVVYTRPTLIWNENSKSMVGTVIIEGANANKIELLYNNNGITYYLNGQLYTP